MTTARGNGNSYGKELDRQAAELGRYPIALVVANIGLWTTGSESLLCGHMKGKGLDPSDDVMAEAKAEAHRRFLPGARSSFFAREGRMSGV